MNELIISNIVILCLIAVFASVILYIISQKFKVIENPKIEEIENILPAANCGACGKAGCRDFATACVNATEEEFKSLYCPVGGAIVMDNVAKELGVVASVIEPTVAVLCCNGNCDNAPNKAEYNGVSICRIAHQVSSGSSGCVTGCLHLGDCVKVCNFGALSLDKTTGMPVVDEDKCTSCGACVKTCPRGLFEIRPKGTNGVRVYVACKNTQKGAIARKNCKVACIGCMKCAKITPEVKIENNLSYIPTSVDANIHGLELVKSCPTGAIICTNIKEN